MLDLASPVASPSAPSPPSPSRNANAAVRYLIDAGSAPISIVKTAKGAAIRAGVASWRQDRCRYRIRGPCSATRTAPAGR
jgi:hypothetical protein